MSDYADQQTREEEHRRSLAAAYRLVIDDMRKLAQHRSESGADADWHVDCLTFLSNRRFVLSAEGD